MNRARELLKQFKKELQLRHYADSSIRTYSSCLWVFFCNHKKFNSYKSIEDVKDFLLTITNVNYHKQMVATIHHFYRLILKQPLTIFDIPYPRKTHYLPEILSVQEVHKLISSIENIKHRAIIQLMYSCAMRIGEVVKVKTNNIDGIRQLLLIKGAKGFKDRYVPLPLATIELLSPGKRNTGEQGCKCGRYFTKFNIQTCGRKTNYKKNYNRGRSGDITFK